MICLLLVSRLIDVIAATYYGATESKIYTEGEAGWQCTILEFYYREVIEKKKGIINNNWMQTEKIKEIVNPEASQRLVESTIQQNEGVKAENSSDPVAAGGALFHL